MVLLAAAVALLAGQARFEGQASARLETRARGYQDPSQGSAAVDAELTPLLAGAVENLGGRVLLGYAPTVRVREPYSDTNRSAEFNQRQFLFATWSREGRPRPYLNESFYFGLIDLRQLALVNLDGTGVPAPNMIPLQNPNGVNFARETSLDVNGGVVWPLGRLTQLDTSAGVFYGGGSDELSRLYLPQQISGRARVRLDHQYSPVTTLGLQAQAQYARFPGLAAFTLGDVTARWRRLVLGTTTFELGLGVGVVAGHASPDPTTRYVVSPVGEGIVQHRLQGGVHQVNFEGAARLVPFVDRFFATAYVRGEITATLNYLFQETWNFAVRGGVARPFTNTAGTELFTAFVEARGGYVARRYWRLDLIALDSTVVVGNGPANNWLVSLALTVHTEGWY